MDQEQARGRLRSERAEVKTLLRDTEAEGRQDRAAEDEQPADIADPAQPLTAEGLADSVAENLRDRLAAIDRALQRLDDGTYERSVRSGRPIPDERLDADPVPAERGRPCGRHGPGGGTGRRGIRRPSGSDVAIAVARPTAVVGVVVAPAVLRDAVPRRRRAGGRLGRRRGRRGRDGRRGRWGGRCRRRRMSGWAGGR